MLAKAETIVDFNRYLYFAKKNVTKRILAYFLSSSKFDLFR